MSMAMVGVVTVTVIVVVVVDDDGVPYMALRYKLSGQSAATIRMR